jgi:ABC-type transport system involved in cytochrome c biogenesis permease component
VVVDVGHTVGANVVALVIAVVGDQVKGGKSLLNVIVQPVMFPDIAPASSLTKSCQVPLALQPFKRLKACSGE